MNRTAKVVIGVASVASLALAGCSSNSSTNDASASPTGMDEYKSAFITAFKTASAKPGMSEEQLNALGDCGWRGAQKDLTADELKEYDTNPNSEKTKEVQAKIEKIGAACQANVNAY